MSLSDPTFLHESIATLIFYKEALIHWNGVTALEELIRVPQLGLVTDVDGTISPIVAQPEEAVVSAGLKQLLTGLRDHLAMVGVISGRAVEDVVHRVGVSNLIYVGNHGFEEWVNGERRVNPQAARFRTNLEAALADLRPLLDLRTGMEVEDKGVTVSIHYRQSPSSKIVHQHDKPNVKAIAKRHQLVFSEGRKVFELRPPVQINKGSAFEKILEEHKLAGAIYIGDDITDISALQVAKKLRETSRCQTYGIGVKTGHPSVISSSDYFASDIEDVEAFLAWFLKARKASST